MIITHKIDMDFGRRDFRPRIDAVQGDRYTRVVELSLYENNVPWAVPEGVSVMTRYRKRDNTGGSYDTLPDGTKAWEANGNLLRITLVPQMLTVDGSVEAQVEIILGASSIGTFTFLLQVEKDPSVGVVGSEDYVNWVSWMNEQVDAHSAQVIDAVNANVAAAAQAAEDAKASADQSAESAEEAKQAAEDAKASAEEARQAVEDAKAVEALDFDKVANAYVWEKWELDLSADSPENAEYLTLGTVVGDDSVDIEIAQSLELSDGKWVLSDPSTVTLYPGADLTDTLLGMYVAQDGEMYQIWSENTALMEDRITETDGTVTTVFTITAYPVYPLDYANRLGFAASVDRAAYPDNGEADGCWYIYRKQLADDLEENPPGAGAHNSIYRGKNLGTSVTAAQFAAIEAGTFDDMYIGDYWVISDVTYRIAAFDYYYLAGFPKCTTHHVTLVPDASMYTYEMNDGYDTTGAYVGSNMYTKGLSLAKNTIDAAFGSAHVLIHRQYLHNAVTDGFASGGSWYDSTVELMTEQNVYGCKVHGNCLNGTALPDSCTVDKSQYPLFAFRPDMISNSQDYWLRDVASEDTFASVHNTGFASSAIAYEDLGVRPAFSIVG